MVNRMTFLLRIFSLVIGAALMLTPVAARAQSNSGQPATGAVQIGRAGALPTWTTTPTWPGLHTFTGSINISGNGSSIPMNINADSSNRIFSLQKSGTRTWNWTYDTQ